ncbi:hypothetical protein LOD99_14752 [Oopsacas minuta]|uniref:Uncharacterized protein n=1 Tax=Oopsacas minuta TaxID=111878 RepID=A0AAV7KC97_9METZ|nr:hypothetical protein LOD99_14752 [Oopsacas minuta]
MFSYISSNYREQIIKTYNAITLTPGKTIERLHLDSQELREDLRIQKYLFKEIIGILSRIVNTTNESVSTELQEIKNKLQHLEEKQNAIDSNFKRIEPFQFHPLSHNLYGFYSARILAPANAPDAFKRMRMIFKYNKGGKLNYFALLPNHEYSLFHIVLEKAKSYEEASNFFERYNRNCFNQSMKVEDKYNNLLKKCIKLQYSQQLINYISEQNNVFKNLMKQIPTVN